MKQLHSGAKWIFRWRVYLSFFFLIIFLASFLIPIMISVSETADNSFLSDLFVFFLLGVVIAVIFGEIYAKFSYKNWKYELTSREVKLERGIIWKKYSAIPFERVQNIDIRRGILARMLGFSTLNIQTAGYHVATQGGVVSEGYIPAVSIKEAEYIREFLIKKIGTKQGL